MTTRGDVIPLPKVDPPVKLRRWLRAAGLRLAEDRVTRPQAGSTVFTMTQFFSPLGRS